jgi:hypothetical protein
MCLIRQLPPRRHGAECPFPRGETRTAGAPAQTSAVAANVRWFRRPRFIGRCGRVGGSSGWHEPTDPNRLKCFDYSCKSASCHGFRRNSSKRFKSRWGHRRSLRGRVRPRADPPPVVRRAGPAEPGLPALGPAADAALAQRPKLGLRCGSRSHVYWVPEQLPATIQEGRSTRGQDKCCALESDRYR